MSKLKLMDYEVVSEMISIGVTPEDYYPRIISPSVTAILIKELMNVGVSIGFVVKDQDCFLLNCDGSPDEYNDFLEVFIQAFRRYSLRTQCLIEAYQILSKGDE